PTPFPYTTLFRSVRLAAAARGIEAVARRFGAAVVKERCAVRNADERGDLERLARADGHGLVVREPLAGVTGRTTRFGRLEQRPAALHGCIVRPAQRSGGRNGKEP